jgi:hypothetical protein
VTLSPAAGQSKSGGGSPWDDKHKASQPERRFLPFWMD